MRCRGRTRLTDDWSSSDRTDMWKRYCRLDFVQTLPLDSDVPRCLLSLGVVDVRHGKQLFVALWLRTKCYCKSE